MRTVVLLLLASLPVAACGPERSAVTPTPVPLQITPAASPTPTEPPPVETATPTAETEELPERLRVSVFLANARACPSLGCEVVLILEENTVVRVLGGARGDEVEGTATWYEVSVEGHEGSLYLHASVVAALE